MKRISAAAITNTKNYLYNNFFTNETNPNRLEDGISVTPDIRATHVAMMSEVINKKILPKCVVKKVDLGKG